MSNANTFKVRHLGSDEVFERHDIFINPNSLDAPPTGASIDPDLIAFHQAFPESKATPLIELPQVAQELGIGHVYVKDESLRFGLPSFKILGASWGVFRAVCEKTSLPSSSSLEEAGHAAQKAGISLVTCTDGNWGRAIARTAKYLGIKATIHVPKTMDEATRAKLRDEGAIVNAVNGSYDDSIAAAMKESESSKSMLVMDTSWEGFERMPKWVVEGYATMHAEVDRQLEETCGKRPTLCIASVGVGSWAQSVVNHYTEDGSSTKIVTVESEAAPCLMESLHNKKIVSVETGSTIMDGMNCGTVSTNTWPTLSTGVYASVVVNDLESHRDVLYLNNHGVNAGPCGAAPLAALRKLHKRGVLLPDPEAVVVLFSTEGYRDYVVPAST
ncbi:tryptophan synthase beta subunit-like PLP-dependent enzyme [Aureobasidium pullulans]|uniref:Tryptophan synthase beta subunit-like PLP-dependent enzyme n=1 Tax=Aureobasidium pullulans TaxID=5580 RepID=A0A4S8Z760_AURPU|nr:tryptophan synthase beta subunit-like PLP-dependent enzyme [Aureobasidium pullulans]THZ96010.1 tryptophan synthase beta subunit-like PLP-dependent enzyme [Aureobasidium pullulans]